MIEGLITDTHKLPNERYEAVDNNGIHDIFQSKHKSLLYRSETVQEAQLYNSTRNLQGAKSFFIRHINRQDKIIYNNSFYRSYKVGLHQNIVVFDMKSYYPTIFRQICNHIDEQYVGKLSRGRVANWKLRRDMNTKFKKFALKKPMQDISDLAKGAIKIDNGQHDEFVKKITQLSEASFVDEIDRRIAKITRNAMVFGFGYKNKEGVISNISALVMFFGREIIRNVIQQLEANGIESVYSHTDCLFLPHIQTRDLDEAIRTACGIVDNQYFGNTEIVSFSLNNIGIKNKFEDLMVLNANSYVASTVAPLGKRDVMIKIAGMNSNSECSMGITQKGESIAQILQDNYADVFNMNKEIEGQDKDFLYGHLKHRLAPEYETRLDEMWRSNDKRVYSRAVKISQTIKNINYLKSKAIA